MHALDRALPVPRLIPMPATALLDSLDGRGSHRRIRVSVRRKSKINLIGGETHGRRQGHHVLDLKHANIAPEQLECLALQLRLITEIRHGHRVQTVLYRHGPAHELPQSLHQCLLKTNVLQEAHHIAVEIRPEDPTRFHHQNPFGCLDCRPFEFQVQGQRNVAS